VKYLVSEKFLFLPMDLREAKMKGWDYLDVILITGDAYVDHPAFGAAVIGRVLENIGLKVGIISQPQDQEDYTCLGTPRLFFGITAGNLDSMLSNYTPLKKKRDRDVYSPGGKVGLRPDRAIIHYTNKVKKFFKKIPIIIGGIEASLRRFVHYDYWDNKLRRSILFDSKANLLVYGMGEKPIIQVAKDLKNGKSINELQNIRGTCVKIKSPPKNALYLPSYSDLKSENDKLIDAFLLIHKNSNPYTAKPLVQLQDNLFLLQNLPILPLKSSELDNIYELPYQYKPHPKYKEEIPAFKTVVNSIITHRGCFGDCNFCSLTIHQGKIIQDRSIESVIREIKRISKLDSFHGTISDLGGPSAEMFGLDCKIKKYCTDKSCLLPEICPHLVIDFSKFKLLLNKARKIPGIKHIFISSGFRFDLLLEDKEFLEELLRDHISGQLKIAPEHIIDYITVKMMNKVSSKKFFTFYKQFKEITKMIGKKIFLVPYWMSAHPGTSLEHQIKLAEFLKKNNLYVKQTQTFTPTPMTASTCMYFTGKDLNKNKIHVPYTFKEKKLQKSLLHFKDPKQYDKIREALKLCKREDLIGSHKNALIKNITKKKNHS